MLAARTLGQRHTESKVTLSFAPHLPQLSPLAALQLPGPTFVSIHHGMKKWHKIVIFSKCILMIIDLPICDNENAIGLFPAICYYGPSSIVPGLAPQQ